MELFMSAFGFILGIGLGSLIVVAVAHAGIFVCEFLANKYRRH